MKKALVVLSILLMAAAIYSIRIGSMRENKNEKELVDLAQQYKKDVKIEEERIHNLNFYQKIFQQRDIDALIIGDSIAQSDGSSNSDKKWFNQVIGDIKQKYKLNINKDFITDDSTTAVRGWVQLNNFKSTKKYDVAFICLGQNDQFAMSTEQFKIFYESIIVKLKKMNPNIEIIPIIESSFKEYNGYSNVIQELSKHYNLQYADTLKAFNSSGQPYESLIKDVMHPNDSGYKYYATSIEKIISDNYTANKKTNINYKPLYKDTNKLTNFITNIPTDSKKGFTLDNGLTSNKVGDNLTYSTTNSVVVVNFLRQPKGGKFKVFIDDKLVEEINTNKTYESTYSNLISNNLVGKHKIKIEISSIDKGGMVKILGLSSN